MARRTSPRRILTRLLTNSGLDKEEMGDVQKTDAFVDEGLSLLENEEPALLDWLQHDPEVRRLLQVQVSATYVMLLRNAAAKRPLSYSMGQLDSLNYRAACALAVAASMRARPRIDLEALDVR